MVLGHRAFTSNPSTFRHVRASLYLCEQITVLPAFRASRQKPNFVPRLRLLWAFCVPPRLGCTAMVYLCLLAFQAKDTATRRREGERCLWKCQHPIRNRTFSFGQRDRDRDDLALENQIACGRLLWSKSNTMAFGDVTFFLRASRQRIRVGFSCSHLTIRLYPAWTITSFLRNVLWYTSSLITFFPFSWKKSPLSGKHLGQPWKWQPWNWNTVRLSWWYPSMWWPAMIRSPPCTHSW